MASMTEDGAFPVHVPADKLTLYLAKEGARVLRVTFHDTSSWCHETSWICTLIPDTYPPNIYHHKFRQQLPALKEQFATHGCLTSIQIDQWMFVFGHDTEDTAWEMTTRYEHIKDIILKFLHEIHAQVRDIKMESIIRKVDAAAARKDQNPETSPRGTTDQDASEPQARKKKTKRWSLFSRLKKGIVRYTGMTGNSRAERSISAGQINTKEINQDNKTVIINLHSGKAVCETCWKAKNKDIPQPTDIDFETLKTLLKELFPESLTHIRWECMVFCFEHESMEDAMGMIVQHAHIKKDILHFLQKLNPSIEDIVMEVEVRELSESEEQTAQTSGSGSHSSVYTSIDPSLKPRVKGHDSDRHASIDLGWNPSQSEEDPRLSTALHVTPSRADRDLHYASRDGDLEKVKRLLSTPGVDINSRGEWSMIPVIEAAWGGHRDVVELLVSEGADVSLVDEDGNNILHLACIGGDVEMVKCVLSLHVVDINCRGRGSRTPVMWAAYWGHRDVVELLVSEGADVSLVDEDGNNILHLACIGGDVETVKYVLSLHVVDIDARNNDGETAADLARILGHQRLVKLLKSRGAQ